MSVAESPVGLGPYPPSLDPIDRPKGADETARDVGNKPTVSDPSPDVRQQRSIRRHLIRISSDRLAQLDLEDPRRRLWIRCESGWAACGWAALFVDRGTGTLLGLPDHCDRPLCPWCERGRRTSRIRARYQAVHDAALGDRRLFLAVLTVPNVPLGQLAAAFDRCRRALERLRRQAWFSSRVAGGLWRLELTVNLETRTWHPHVNLLLETRRRESMQRYLQPQLQRAWRRALGDPEGFAGDWSWLEQGWDRALPAIREAVKRQVAWRFEQGQPANEPADVDLSSSLVYSAKPPGSGWVDEADPAWVIEYVESQAGRRAIGTFGSWRKVPVAKPEHADELLTEAPFAPGDDLSPWAPKRWLPAYVPTLPRAGRQPAEWEFYGRGPRWALRPVRPPDGGDPWLVWTEGPDPSQRDVDGALPSWPLRLAARAGP